MVALRVTGPASIEVWISSPVRSRKPVLMNTIRSPAARIAAARFSEVRRSSSMRPIFSVFGASPSSCSTRPNSVAVKATSSGPCCFGLTMYTDPVRLLRAGASARRPGSAQTVVDDGVEDPLGHLRPAGVEDRVGGHQVADVPHQQQRPAGQGEPVPCASRYVWLVLRRRVKAMPFLNIGVLRSPVFRPSQLR